MLILLQILAEHCIYFGGIVLMFSEVEKIRFVLRLAIKLYSFNTHLNISSLFCSNTDIKVTIGRWNLARAICCFQWSFLHNILMLVGKSKASFTCLILEAIVVN
jgi:hypothetical protein